MSILNQELKLSNIHQGDSLPTMVKRITQKDINLYAEASGDFNPIHVDETFAAQTPLGGTIAHGMLILAYVSHFMTAAFGRNWLTSGKISIRFRSPARPGDIITVSGKIVNIEKGETETLVSCGIICQNQKDESIITGETSVRVKNNEDSY